MDLQMHVAICFIISFPFSTGLQTLHEICVSQCVDEVFSSGKTVSYDDCMHQCFASNGDAWILVNDADDHCGILPTMDADSETPCSTLGIATESETRNVSDPYSDAWAIREFIVVTWSPCPFGMSDVRGYEIELLEVDGGGMCYYKQLSLSRSLSKDDRNKEFSVLFHRQELDYGRNYKILIGGLPKTNHNFGTYVIHRAKSCTDLNGVGSCVCGLDGLDQAAAVNATVNGYRVKAVVPALKRCFHIIKYRLLLLLITRTNRTTTVKKFDIMGNNGLMHHEFYPVYNPSESRSLALQYIAYDRNGKIVHSKPAMLDILDWKPNILSIFPGRGELVALWKCAPRHYNVTKYEIQLNWYGLNPTYGVRHRTLHNYNASKSCLVGQNASLKLISVRLGYYTVQVRERRFPSDVSSNWSLESRKVEVQESQVKVYSNKHSMILAASVLFPLTTIIIAVMVFLFCLRKGHCGKIHQSIPPVAERLLKVSSNPTLPHICKTVWIVWQADNDNEHVNELHAENVRHLAAFFANHCGLRIILDQYEVTSAPSFLSWLGEKQKCAEVVLFVYPHVALLREKDLPVQLCGNFLAVFNLYRRALLEEQSSIRFATVLLPYSDIKACKEAKLLLETTPIFRLMTDVESLYFFIQNRVKSGPFGRRVVKYVNKHEYQKTPEGHKLRDGIEKIVNAESRKMSFDTTCLSSGKARKSEECSGAVNDLKERRLDVVSPPEPVPNCFVKESTRKFHPHPPPSILAEEDADQSMFLINTRELLSQQPIDSEPISPVMSSHCALLPNRPDFSAWFHPHFYNNV